MRLPRTAVAPADARYNASAECWRLYGELTVNTVAWGYGDGAFIHQLAVDAYGAQHAGEHARPIGVAFALIGLYLAFEWGYSGLQVQQTHTLMARRSKTWPRFAPPSHGGDLTVRDVLQAAPGATRDDVLWRWGRAI